MKYAMMTANYRPEQTPDGKRPVVYLTCRDEQGERHVVRLRGFRPYFWRPAEDWEVGSVRDIFGRPVVKEYTEMPGDVPQARKKYPWTCEADIPFPWRVVTDLGIRDSFKHDGRGKPIPLDEPLDVEPNYCLYDIEVASPTEIMPRPAKPEWPICTFQLFNTYERRGYVFWLNSGETDPPKGVIAYDKEKDMLEGIAEHFEEKAYDVSSGWFSNQFDWPYFLRRAELLNAEIRTMSPLKYARCLFKPPPKGEKKKWGQELWEPRIGGHECVDLLQLYRNLTKPEGQKPSWDLKFIVWLETGWTYEDLGDRVDYFWRYEPEVFLEYCYNDLVALLLVDEARNLLPYFDRIRRRVGCAFSLVHKNSRVMDAEYLRSTEGHPLPTRIHREEESKEKGALVLRPPRGYVDHTALFDISSMYPSIMVALNLSAETYDPVNGDIVVGNWKFKSTPQGIVPRVTEKQLMERRMYAAKKNNTPLGDPKWQLNWTEEQASKFLANTNYGVNGYVGFRLYQPAVQGATTFVGRMVIGRLRDRADAEGFKSIYGDTDSVFVQVPLSETEWLEDALNDELRKIAQELNAKFPLELKFEKYFETVFFDGKKKHWAGRVTQKDGKPCDMIEIKGLASRRSDTATVTVEDFAKVLEHLIKKEIVEAKQIVRRRKEEWEGLPIHAIGAPKGMSRRPEEYDNFAWANAVIYSRQHLGYKFHEDHKPRLVYVKAVHGKPRTPYVAVLPDTESVPSEVVVDYELQWKKVYRKKLEPIFKIAGISWSEVIHNVTQTRIFEYA